MNSENYQKWQEENADQLMDGTTTKKSYLRLVDTEQMEVGIQPRLVRANPMHLAFLARLRVAFKPEFKDENADNPQKLMFGVKLVTPDEPLPEEALPATGRGAKPSKGTLEITFPQQKLGTLSARSQALRDIMPNADFRRINNDRASTGISIPLPFNMAQAQNFRTAILDGNLAGLLIKAIVSPEDGWNPAMLETATKALADYLLLTADQFDLFVESPLIIGDSVVQPPSIATFLDKLEQYGNGTLVETYEEETDIEAAAGDDAVSALIANAKQAEATSLHASPPQVQ